jgi:fructose-1,6-bisphosphatase/inositol monophosphatase family enzyme
MADEAALAGGVILRKYYGTLDTIGTKEGGDLVTVADHESEAVVA